jgi:hypothetical protein
LGKSFGRVNVGQGFAACFLDVCSGRCLDELVDGPDLRPFTPHADRLLAQNLDTGTHTLARRGSVVPVLQQHALYRGLAFRLDTGQIRT